MFYSADPAPLDAPATLVGDPRLSSSYTLNHGNSLRYSDPDGRMPMDGDSSFDDSGDDSGYDGDSDFTDFEFDDDTTADTTADTVTVGTSTAATLTTATVGVTTTSTVSGVNDLMHQGVDPDTPTPWWWPLSKLTVERDDRDWDGAKAQMTVGELQGLNELWKDRLQVGWRFSRRFIDLGESPMRFRYENYLVDQEGGDAIDWKRVPVSWQLDSFQNYQELKRLYKR